MKQILKRWIGPAVLTVGLILPSAVTDAQQRHRQVRGPRQAEVTSTQQGSTDQTQQRGRRGRRGATSADSSTAQPQTQQASSKGGSVTVVGRVNQATLSSAVIQGVKRNPILSASVRIRGNTIFPAGGYSLWGLSNGGFLAVESVEPHAMEQEQVLKFVDGQTRLVTYVCYCPGSSGSDPCQFAREAGGTAINLGKCQNATCCQSKCVYVDEEGNSHEC
jgi:hypothetical protein